MGTLGKILLFAVSLFLMTATSHARQTLVIATNHYPPYVTEDNNSSFLRDLFDEIGNRININFEFHFYPWKRCEQMVAEEIAWGTIPYRKTATRQESFLFSDPLYLADSHFFAYSADGSKPPIKFDTLTDLQPYRLGGIQGYYYEPWFTQAGLDVTYALSEEQNFQLLQHGRIDLFSTATTMGWYMIESLFPPEEVAKFYTLEKPLVAGEGLFLMTSKDYPQTRVLLEKFNRGLQEIKTDGTFAKLVHKHGLVMTN
ncbi:ABC transporter substrate-binding protein [Thalassospira profundimaris]|uniref:ABC transporter substrate-binding protein n=1 Tax=Thalassospira profundimaris TaxID=502049 RepID=A0A367WUR4_9PROT|nr:transporter substrate-binding domain-containing protein [Thalassospira profundimaris]RCK44192.1 ABC transporter substrate-binding protein [Thalassospira profundimaris]